MNTDPARDARQARIDRIENQSVFYQVRRDSLRKLRASTAAQYLQRGIRQRFVIVGNTMPVEELPPDQQVLQFPGWSNLDSGVCHTALVLGFSWRPEAKRYMHDMYPYAICPHPENPELYDLCRAERVEGFVNPYDPDDKDMFHLRALHPERALVPESEHIGLTSEEVIREAAKAYVHLADLENPRGWQKVPQEVNPWVLESLLLKDRLEDSLPAL